MFRINDALVEANELKAFGWDRFKKYQQQRVHFIC
jgi:hypothetical protein